MKSRESKKSMVRTVNFKNNSLSQNIKLDFCQVYESCDIDIRFSQFVGKVVFLMSVKIVELPKITDVTSHYFVLMVIHSVNPFLVLFK